MNRSLVFLAALGLLVCRSEPAPTPPPPIAGEIRNAIGMVFVPIPGGVLATDNPAAATSSIDPFYLGRFEVTQAQWSRLMDANPSAYREPDHPVENVSWLEAQTFVEKLNALDDGWRYRLPGETEWEYACRAGTTTAFSCGDELARLDDYAWTRRNAGKRHHPVGQKLANAWGLHDMHGNVWEWCADQMDLPGPGPADRTARVYRGGSFHYHPVYARSDYRLGFWEDYRSIFIGLRLVAEPPSTEH